MKPIVYILMALFTLHIAFAGHSTIAGCANHLSATFNPNQPTYAANPVGQTDQIVVRMDVSGIFNYQECVQATAEFVTMCENVNSPSFCAQGGVLELTGNDMRILFQPGTVMSPVSGDSVGSNAVYDVMANDPPTQHTARMRVQFDKFGQTNEEVFEYTFIICRGTDCTLPAPCPLSCGGNCGQLTEGVACGNVCQPATVNACGYCEPEPNSFYETQCQPQGLACIDNAGTPQCSATADTNAFVTDGRVQLCGTHWNVDPAYDSLFEMNSICRARQDATMQGSQTESYICTVTDEGWRWVRDGSSLQSGTSIRSGTPAWTALTAEVQTIGGVPINTFQEVVCDNGFLLPGVNKFNPTKSQDDGCAINKCYRGPGAGGPDCALEGEYYSANREFQCVSVSGTAFWESATSKVARYMLNELSNRGDLTDDFTLNCGGPEVAQNSLPDASNFVGQERGYCQLALLNGQEEATEIWTGIAIAPAVNNTGRIGFIEGEIGTMQATGTNPTTIQEIIAPGTYGYYNEVDRVLLFSTINVQQEPFNMFQQLWEYLRSFFIDTNEVHLAANGAEEIFVQRDNGVTNAIIVERMEPTPAGRGILDTGEECIEPKQIRYLATNATECYTDQRWRAEVQQR